MDLSKQFHLKRALSSSVFYWTAFHIFLVKLLLIKILYIPKLLIGKFSTHL